MMIEDIGTLDRELSGNMLSEFLEKLRQKEIKEQTTKNKEEPIDILYFLVNCYGVDE